MAKPDRLSGLDASFLAFEKDGAHMHVGSVLLFEGPAPDHDDFVAKIAQGLHLVPRYRQRLPFPPPRAPRPPSGRASPPRRSAPRGRSGSTIRTSTGAITSAIPRCPSRPVTTSCGAWPGGCS